MLRVNRTLKELNLADNGIGDRGVLDVAASLYGKSSDKIRDWREVAKQKQSAEARHFAGYCLRPLMNCD